MTGGFDGFVAIDWSGAAGKRYRGIAVAECASGSGAPSLVRPPKSARPWTRTQVLDWLDWRIGQGGRLLIGIDCAFSLPFDTAASYFQQGDGTVFDLWDLVERVCEARPGSVRRRFPAPPCSRFGILDRRPPAGGSGAWPQGDRGRLPGRMVWDRRKAPIS